jgi:hypothetical protein
MYNVLFGIPTSNTSAEDAVMIALWISYDTVIVFFVFTEMYFNNVA